MRELSDKVRKYISANPFDGPRLILDIDAVRTRIQRFETLFDKSKIYYAMKANPNTEVLKLLRDMGHCFDAASRYEIQDLLDLSVDPKKISYGNTLKKERDIAFAYEAGIELFVFDCAEELHKLSRAAPGCKVMCRFLCDNGGAEWPLSRKFGCFPERSIELMVLAKQLGLTPYGLAFHVGSQQLEPSKWEHAIWNASNVAYELRERGIELKLLNFGGGFPADYDKEYLPLSDYADVVYRAIRSHFKDFPVETMFEPGRALVADAGVLETEVVLVTRKAPEDLHRWVYIDVGLFTGLAETMGEAIRYDITMIDGNIQNAELEDAVLAGPTCDSADVIYEKTPYPLPLELQAGDKLYFHSAGAYTHTYASHNFNGFKPMAVVVI